MKALVIGAGAVGQVYGRHLQLGGAEVAFLVKPKYAEECRRGFSLYPLNRRNPRTEAVTFSADVLTSLDEVKARAFDQVYLCMSSTGLRGEWLKPLLEATADATVVMLQPALDDRDYVAALLGRPERLVVGMISLISYHAPLPGERVPQPGMAYWFPPLSPSIYSGSRAASVVSALGAGKLPAKEHPDVTKATAFPGAALMMLIAALEESDWSFDKLTHGDRLPLACDANREVVTMLEKKLGVKAPLPARALRPFLVRLGLPVARRLIPLDLETYFRSHFTKVGDQTRFMIQGYVAQAKKLRTPTDRLEALLRKLPQA